MGATPNINVCRCCSRCALFFVQASAIPLAGGTAWEAIIRRLAVRLGKTPSNPWRRRSGRFVFSSIWKSRRCESAGNANGDNEDILAQLAGDVTIDYRKKDAAEPRFEKQSVKAPRPRSILRASISSPGCLGRIVCVLPPQRDWSLLDQKNITLHGSFFTREHRGLKVMGPVTKGR